MVMLKPRIKKLRLTADLRPLKNTKQDKPKNNKEVKKKGNE